MKLHGIIVAADVTAKTITIECDGSISGITLAGRVVVDEVSPEPVSKISSRPIFVKKDSAND